MRLAFNGCFDMLLVFFDVWCCMVMHVSERCRAIALVLAKGEVAEVCRGLESDVTTSVLVTHLAGACKN